MCADDIRELEDIFQSTPPVRGATELAAAAAIITTISIHAPRAGSDRENSDIIRIFK